LEAIYFIRGPKLEEENPDHFKFDKLVAWFTLNIQTLRHLDMKKADQDWLRRKTRREMISSLSLPKPTKKPDPKKFLRRTIRDRYLGANGIEHNYDLGNQPQNLLSPDFHRIKMGEQHGQNPNISID